MNEKSNHHHDYLAGEHPLNHLGQLISLIVFLVVWIADSFVYKFSTELSDLVPGYGRFTLGVALIIAAIYILFSSERIIFNETEAKDQVVNKGAFSYVRHPLYLGVLMIYLSLLAFTLSVTSMLFFIITFAFYDSMASFEEKRLEEKFGQDYSEYRKRVSKWIPVKRLVTGPPDH